MKIFFPCFKRPAKNFDETKIVNLQNFTSQKTIDLLLQFFIDHLMDFILSV